MSIIYTHTKKQGHQLLTLQVTHTPAMIAPMVNNRPQFGAFWPKNMPILTSEQQRAATGVVQRIMRSRVKPDNRELMTWLWSEMYDGCGYVITPVYSDGARYTHEHHVSLDLVGWLVCDVQRVLAFGGEWDHSALLSMLKSEAANLSQYAGDGIYRVSLFRSAFCEKCTVTAPFSRTDWPGMVMPVSCVIERDGKPLGPSMATLAAHYVVASAADMLADWRDF